MPIFPRMRGEELGEALEAVDRDALEGRGVHPLDAGEELDEPRGVAGLEGGDGEAAVAGHDGGDAVVAARRAVGLEGELGVVVRVRVDDARGHDPAGGVDDAGALVGVHEPDGGDAPVLDGDVGPAARETGAVDHDAVGDDQVVGVVPGSRRHASRLEHVLVCDNRHRHSRAGRVCSMRKWATSSPVSAGVALVVAGFIALFLAWNGAAGKDFVEGQLPYLISGGLVGLGLIASGLTVVNVQSAPGRPGRAPGAPRRDHRGAGDLRRRGQRPPPGRTHPHPSQVGLSAGRGGVTRGRGCGSARRRAAACPARWR